MKRGITDRVTEIISGKNHFITTLSALGLTAIVSLAGIWMADTAKQLQKDLSGSLILENFNIENTTTTMKPDKVKPFLRYLNAMAPAVLNLDILPDVQLHAFDTIYDAANDKNITLNEFNFEATERSMRIKCTAKNTASAMEFYNIVKNSGVFYNVSLLSGKVETNFTIVCIFVE